MTIYLMIYQEIKLKVIQIILKHFVLLGMLLVSFYLKVKSIFLNFTHYKFCIINFKIILYYVYIRAFILFYKISC